MAKWRILVTVLNPGFENTEFALGTLQLDFELQDSFEAACEEVRLRSSDSTPGPVFITNDRDEIVSWNSRYYHSLWAGPIEEFTPPPWWALPPDGTSPGPFS